jgi:hypothetical protein
MRVDPSPTLHELLPMLASLLTDVPIESPVAVGVRLLPDRGVGRTVADEIELHFRHLDCTDAVCALGGFVAPAAWQAFGIVAPGRSVPLDADGEPLDDPGTQVVAGTFVGRSGEVASQVRTATGAVLADGPADGRVLDVCRRVLGLPTAAAAGSPQVWATVVWVDAVLAASLLADLGEPPRWPALAALDPLGEAVDLGALRWPLVRASCAAGLVAVPGMSAELAAWMDDGMFAREAVSALPPLFEMLSDLRELLPPHEFERVVGRVGERLAT